MIWNCVIVVKHSCELVLYNISIYRIDIEFERADTEAKLKSWHCATLYVSWAPCALTDFSKRGNHLKFMPLIYVICWYMFSGQGSGRDQDQDTINSSHNTILLIMYQSQVISNKFCTHALTMFNLSPENLKHHPIWINRISSLVEIVVKGVVIPQCKKTVRKGETHIDLGEAHVMSWDF